jgi:hypothetical protein
MFHHFWQGRYTLGLAFWVFWLLGILLVNSVMAAALMAMTEPSLVLIVACAVLGWGYVAWASVGTWRSAGRYAGPRWHAYAARALVAIYVVWSVAMLGLMVSMLVLGGNVFLNPPFIR